MTTIENQLDIANANLKIVEERSKEWEEELEEELMDGKWSGEMEESGYKLQNDLVKINKEK
ncbi:4844_t:CDS:2, partial [Entrophospora sp. SA101]